MLITDLYESNANSLLAELRMKLAKVQSVRASAKAGGDYEETVAAYMRTIQAAIDAVEKQIKNEAVRASAA